MAQKKMKPLTEAPVKGSVSDNYFYRMLSPQALRISAPYHQEENAALDSCFAAHPETKDMNFIAVGGGELWELRRAMTHAKRYVCIEPLADIFLNDSVQYLVEQFDNISFIGKRFGDVQSRDLPSGNSLFMFLFNILAYLEDPIASINKLAKPGDILFLTTWANTPQAKRIRKTYFDYLNAAEEKVEIDPEDTVGLCHLDNFPFQKLSSFKKVTPIHGAITDILIIYM